MGVCVKVCVASKGVRGVLLMLISLTHKVVHTPVGFDGGDEGF